MFRINIMPFHCGACKLDFFSNDGLIAHKEKKHKIIVQKDNRVLDSFS
ncbi:conserved hypothetical protein [Candidatus Nitrosotenuis uzonensis]|uniref:C2H2-type domain-containing protein n=1 Tax=Candidatus Nitrosotenuis uzonensis TaxID=1407055 RepID=A0A812F012_9ARCH|nr:conserved hypothetical protein [Candidatus Nitrosotenuis uzonensis]